MAHTAVYERELVVGHALHEVAVVAHDEQRARPAVEQVLEHGEHVGVEVVAGFVEHEDVGLVEDDAEQRQAAPLAAREVRHEALELALVEAQALTELGGAEHLAADHIAALIAREDLEQAPILLVGEGVQVLAHPAELDRGADLDAAVRGGEAAGHELQQRRLAGAVLAEDAVAVAGADEPIDAVDHGRVGAGVAETDLLHGDYLLAEAAHGEALELERVSQRRVVGDELAGGVDAELRLARAGLRAVREPVQLLAKRVLAALLHDGGLTVALAALLDVGGVAALERGDLAVVDLPHVLADLVQKPAVVRDDEKGALTSGPVALDRLGEPGDGPHVEMVRRLVHEHDVPGAGEKAREVAAAALAAGELAHEAVPVQVADELVDDAADARVARPDVLGGIADDGVADGLVVAERVALAEVTDVDVVSPGHRSGVGLDEVSCDVEKRRLAVAVLADDADALALHDSDGEVVEHALVGPLVADVLHADEDSHMV